MTIRVSPERDTVPFHTDVTDADAGRVADSRSTTIRCARPLLIDHLPHHPPDHEESVVSATLTPPVGVGVGVGAGVGVVVGVGVGVAVGVGVGVGVEP